MNIIYTFNNIKKFDEIILKNLFNINIKFISYGDYQLKVIFEKELSNEQELILLDLMKII
jgi:hypothetical protein